MWTASIATEREDSVMDDTQDARHDNMRARESGATCAPRTSLALYMTPVARDRYVRAAHRQGTSVARFMRQAADRYISELGLDDESGGDITMVPVRADDLAAVYELLARRTAHTDD